MAEIELSRLNSQSFERLVRALAFAEMGAGGTVFSSGPDGARDFILEGKIPGFESRSWEGYLVVQVKFKQTLVGGQEDIDWLIAQIQQELKKFQDPNRKLKKPDYVLIATNVRISGVITSTKKGKRVGGHRKISDAFEEWKQSLNLKDFHIWGGDQIVDLLMKHAGVRQSFAGFVLGGDVLTKLLDQFDAKQKDFSQIIQRAIIRRLSADQYVPLNESGSVDHKKIPTNKVFIDLPVFLPSELHKAPEELDGFVARLINISKCKLNSYQQSNSTLGAAEASKVSGNIVLLGGPGQGKSTTGLFAVQLFRSAIVRENALSSVDPTIRDLIPAIIERAQAQGLSTDIPRRFPVHVSLPGYADRISEAKKAKSDQPSLLAHMAYDLSRAADSNLDREDLRRWLSSYPWLVVLDGLDEVPPSGERPAVIEAIEAFLSEIAQAGADVLVVVTSRPQGYNKDLSEKHWRHWHLADLEETQALSYADALSLAQHPLDPDRRAKIRGGLERAMQQPATARLMVSPLQVTIMHLIIDGGGSAPVGRWALFNEYYQVLKKREKAKGGETQEVLERNWDHLDPVHHRAGLVLQTEAERSGGATAQLNPARLKALILGYLEACGYEGSDREIRAEELRRLSLNRLVLLTMRQQGVTEDDGSISFDVRSLQEFMAAAELTTESEALPGDVLVGKQPKIEDRLTHIAGMSHWRHVFLIAASRCFSETALHYLRSTIVAIPRALDAHEGDRLSCTGASLALEMLVDGIGSNHPISRCKLVEHAMDLLELGPENFDGRLASIWSSETSGIYADRLKARLSEGTSPAALAAWKLLSLLLRSENNQFADIARQYWPKDANSALTLLNALDYRVPRILASEAKLAISSVSFTRLESSHLRTFVRSLTHDPENALRFLVVIAPSVDHQAGFFLFSADSPLRVLPALVGSERLQAFSEDVTGWHQSWHIIKHAAELARSGSVESLSDCLKAISSSGLLKELKSSYAVLPWVLEAFLHSASGESDLISFSDRSLRGDFGDRGTWSRAEERWEKAGISQKDLLASASSAPFPKNVDEVGAPMLRHLSFMHARVGGVDKSIVQIIESIRTLNGVGVLSSQLCFAAQFLLGVARVSIKVPQESFLYLFENVLPTAPDVLCLYNIEDSAWDNDEIVQRLEKVALRSHIFWSANEKLDVTAIVGAYRRNPSRRSLLFLIVYALLCDSEGIVKTVANLPDSAFQHLEREDWRVSGAVAVLRVMKGYDISPDIADCLISADAPNSLRRFVERMFEIDFLKGDVQEKLAVFVTQRLLTLNPQQAWWPRPLLKKVLDSRKSGLSDRSVWVERLRLPPDAFNVLKPVLPL